MPTEFNQHVDELTNDSKAYIKSMLAYYKLDAYKKSAKTMSVLLRIFVFAGFFLLFFAFLLVGFALFIGELVSNYYFGFFAMALLNLLLILFVLTKGKKMIEKMVLSIFAEIFQKQK